MDGRIKIRNVLKGKNTEAPPFVPLVFSLAARTGNMGLEQMATDPGYYTSALEGIGALLGLDMMLVNLDTTLECEALGAMLTWRPGDTLPLQPPQERLSAASPDEFVNRGRIPVVLETIHRISGAAGRSTAVACAVLGPCAFASHLQTCFKDAREKKPGDLIKEHGGLLVKLTRALCDLKVDALLFREDPLVDSFAERLFKDEAAYRSVYNTLFNIVRAFDAIPLIVTGQRDPDVIRQVHTTLKPGGMVLQGDKVSEDELGALQGLADSLRIAVGVPIDIASGDTSDLWEQVDRLNRFAAQRKPKNIFYTSAGELSPDVDLELLISMTERLKESFQA